MSKHTPGPWHFVESNVGAMPDHGYCLLHGEPAEFGWEKSLFVVVGASGNAIRALGEGAPEANAKLIAAAPELLAAAQAAWNCIAELSPTQARVEVGQMLTAAIAKATGEA